MRIGRRHVVSAEMARDMGVDDVTRRLVDFADTLKSYDVDIYDIVAMKTLLLLSPGSVMFVAQVLHKVHCLKKVPPYNDDNLVKT